MTLPVYADSLSRRLFYLLLSNTIIGLSLYINYPTFLRWIQFSW